jgi:hypothetical protein
MQSVFKVDLVIRNNGANDQPATKKQRPFAPRKTHQKSRNGCVACKKRRIKVSNTYDSLDQTMLRRLTQESAMSAVQAAHDAAASKLIVNTSPLTLRQHQCNPLRPVRRL